MELSIQMYTLMMSWWILQCVPESSIWRLKVKSNHVKPISFSTAIVGDGWKDVEECKGSAGALLLHGNRPPQRSNP